MKSLTNYIKDNKSSLISLAEKLVIIPSQVDEKLVINKNYDDIYAYHPKDRNELELEIRKHYNKGIYDLNDIDTSKITDFSKLFQNDKNTGNKDFNVSKWDVSNGENFNWMFSYCHKFNCNLSDWDVRKGENFGAMFYECYKFNCNLSDWNVLNGEWFYWMFEDCKKFNCDLSKWKIKNNAKTDKMFKNCPIEDKYKPKGIE